uniref:Leucine-rich repeat-containing N-terminal plant-type domain-containing protein n=1 Tax=Phaseolus vulgaris TaxID=3885 RepID=V7CRA7_PHAVU|nr:hypothetical protein PHAVU_002G276600g [Phaseolus vulgaris]ESW31888.1 hypothetical protein PHAVU_002G276600g [Phaseolus vulgaris]
MFRPNFSRGLLKILTRWLIFLSILTVSSAIKDPDVEGEALLDLLHFLNDSNKQITDWDSHLVSPCFSWSHVTCRNGHVISLALASVGFVGTLSLSITKLKYLVCYLYHLRIPYVAAKKMQELHGNSAVILTLSGTKIQRILTEISGADTAKSGCQSVGYANSFAFKLEDLSGRVHRFNCDFCV